MSYPNPDGTANLEVALFPAGVTSFNEDYEKIESDIERESLTRSVAIAKTTGIIAKRADEGTTLFPSVVSGNQISITAGNGMTQNGSIINIPVALTVNDITGVTGYSLPSPTNYVFIVLRKITESYGNRSHPLTGIQYPTRRRFKTDNTIVECISQSSTLTEINDRDVIVLGRLMSVTPATLDTTEATGFRKILRVTETPTMETGIVNEMMADIEMGYRYQILNLPEWGEQYWIKTGSVNNQDFHRLFARVNQHTAVMRGVKFQAVTGGYGIQFANDAYPKIKIFPAQQPPVSIDIIKQNEQVVIPDNYVLYLTLTDNQLFVTTSGGGGGGIPEIGGDSSPIGGGQVGATFSTASITSSNLGSASGNLRRFPICWHYYNGTSGDRKLVFVDGTILRLNDEITDQGQHSAYLRREGATVSNNYLTGDLEIRKNSGKVLLTQGGSGTPESDIQSGIQWKKEAPFNGVTIGEFVRYIAGSASENPPPAGVSNYDIYLTVYDNDGLQGKSFVFAKNGKLQIINNIAPAENKDVLTVEYGLDKRGDSLTSVSNHMTGNFRVQKDNPEVLLQDTTAGGFAGIGFKNTTGQDIGGVYQLHGDAGGYYDGDLRIRTDKMTTGEAKEIVLRRQTGHLEMPNMLVSGDGTINDDLTVHGSAQAVQSLYVGSSNADSGDSVIFLTDRAVLAPTTAERALYAVDYTTNGLGEVSGRYNLRTQLGSQAGNLVNHTDGTNGVGGIAIGASDTDIEVAVDLPSYSNYSKLLIVVNCTLKSTDTQTANQLTFTVKDQSGSQVHIFNDTILGSNNTKYYGTSYQFMYVPADHPANTESLKLWVKQSGSDTLTSVNDSTGGYSRIDYITIY